MAIIVFPGHRLHRECRRDGCPVCNGGLGLCEVCGGAEAAMPTDCPGRPMTGSEMDRVQAGRIDYRRREGWVVASGALA